jgi:hypothetical protein
MLPDQRPQLGRERARRAESQVGLEALLQAGQLQLFQSRDLSLCERLVAEVGQRRAAP